MKSIAVAAVVGCCALSAAQAMAQSAPAAPGSNLTIPEKDPSAGGKHPPVAASPIEGRSLSNRLNQSNGVISPPAGIDPGIEKKAPVEHPNSTPVIPPPGASGGSTKAK